MYADIDEASLDDVIRRLDQNDPNIPDTDQYKLSNIKEDALNNKLKHLDVMWFPTLGRFGDGH